MARGNSRNRGSGNRSRGRGRNRNQPRNRGRGSPSSPSGGSGTQEPRQTLYEQMLNELAGRAEVQSQQFENLVQAVENHIYAGTVLMTYLNDRTKVKAEERDIAAVGPDNFFNGSDYYVPMLEKVVKLNKDYQSAQRRLSQYRQENAELEETLESESKGRRRAERAVARIEGELDDLKAKVQKDLDNYKKLKAEKKKRRFLNWMKLRDYEATRGSVAKKQELVKKLAYKGQVTEPIEEQLPHVDIAHDIYSAIKRSFEGNSQRYQRLTGNSAPRRNSGN